MLTFERAATISPMGLPLTPSRRQPLALFEGLLPVSLTPTREPTALIRQGYFSEVVGLAAALPAPHVRRVRGRGELGIGHLLGSESAFPDARELLDCSMRLFSGSRNRGSAFGGSRTAGANYDAEHCNDRKIRSYETAKDM